MAYDNAFERGKHGTKAQQATEHNNGWVFAKRLSDALLKVRPLGGSELFVKRNNDYYADPDYCGRMIEEMRNSLDKEIRARIRLERLLETATAPESPQGNASE